MTLGERLRRAPWSLPILAAALTGLGIATIATAADGHVVAYAWLQTRWAVVGLAAALLVLAAPYARVVQWAPVLYGVGLASLVLVLFKGTGQSAGRWIGIGAFRVQPSEFMKPILVVMLAATLRYSTEHRRLGGLVKPVALTLVPFLLVMRQPDLGTAILFVPIAFAVLFAAGARLRHLGILAAGGLAAATLLALVPGVLKDYQRDRIFGFLAQHGDSTAAKSLERSQNHQSHQGRIAIGLGGLTGVDDADGGAEEASRDVPERHSDFIFAVFAAKHGFVGVTLLFLLYGAFLGALLSVASRLREPSGRFLAVGMFAMFATQIVVNLGMVAGLLPVVGVPAPFLTYGGSNLLMSWLAIGLLLAVGSDPPIEFGRTTYGD
jgi:rod shape determining protein RodA